MGEPRGDTRQQIQAVALELFAEQGYEKTALREIAERLHVTKAALYYHFRTKEDIIVSLFDDLIASMDELIAWGREQPATVETRRELVRRYAERIYGRGPTLMRFAQENQGTMRDLAVGENLRTRMGAIRELMTDRKAPLASQLRTAMALVTVNASMFVPEESAAPEEERRAAGVEVALELISSASRMS
jgi:AcrR family transcriptional regulator